ncbi:MAG: GNAT family N-acetyltransferase [Acidobacteriaceae bacterium]|jgi:ribosomal-protein-alanine N-acetyltransferase
MTPALETPRLLLRPLALEDAEPIEAVFPHWEIVRYLNAIVPWPFPKGAALAHIRDHALPAMERGDEWHWTLRRKIAPDQLIGRIHLARGEGNNRGFWIVPECGGQGLMTEAVLAVTDYWFDVLKFPVLRAPKAVANVASRRISEKTGMRLVGVIEQDYVCGRLPGEIWEVTAEEWRAFRKARV